MTTTLSNGMAVTLRFYYAIDKRKRRTVTALVEAAAPAKDAKNERIVVFSATTTCSTKDKFTKSIGRLEALHALFAKYRLPKQDWQAIMTAYTNRSRESYPCAHWRRLLGLLPDLEDLDLEPDTQAKQAMEQSRD